MKKIIIILIILIKNIIYIFKKLYKGKDTFSYENVTKERNLVKPIFTSSFIQKWCAKDFTLERWIDELQMLRDVGITEIILQSVVDTKDKYAVYPTEINGYSANNKDMILLALNAAKIVGMKVRIGLGENDDWWKKGWYDFSWLSEEAAISNKIFNEVFEKYGCHEALGGWYITYEFSEFFATTKFQQQNLSNFYKTLAKEIKSKSNLDIMISPFYGSNKFKIGCLELWVEILQAILRNTGIDTLALQDSVGVGYNTIDDIKILFNYTKKATDDLGITLYVDTETFSSTKDGNIPATQEQISKQIAAVKPYVKGFVVFSIDHFQNKNLSSQMNNYLDYLSYYNENHL